MTQPKLSLFGDAKAYSEGRAYRRPTDGSNHPSVTTILKAADKSGLIQWAVDRAVDWCVENWMTLGERSDTDAKRIARFQHNKVRDDRAEVGDGVHAWVEAEHTDWNYPELNDEQEQIVQQWEILKTEYDIEPVLTEFTTFIESDDGANTCMGTADGFWRIDGVPTLIDVKTSNNTWPEHYAQLAALSHGKEWYEQVKEIPPEITDVSPKKMQAFLEEHWQRREMPEFEALALIHLKKDMREIVWIPMDEVRYHWAKFEGYMKVWSATEELKAIEKGRKLAQKEEW